MDTNEIWIGNDHGGFDLKLQIVESLKKKGIAFNDVGTGSTEIVRYPYFAQKVASAVSEGRAARGILICSTGIGMSIIANKFKGVNAVCVESVFSARMARVINDANVLTMGAMMIAPWMAKAMVDTWLETKHTVGLESFAGFL